MTNRRVEEEKKTKATIPKCCRLWSDYGVEISNFQTKICLSFLESFGINRNDFIKFTFRDGNFSLESKSYHKKIYSKRFVWLEFFSFFSLYFLWLLMSWQKINLDLYIWISLEVAAASILLLFFFSFCFYISFVSFHFILYLHFVCIFDFRSHYKWLETQLDKTEFIESISL